MARDAQSTTRSIGTTTLLEAGIVINMKTVEELLGYLEPEIKEKALKNAEDQDTLNNKVMCIAAAIDSFIWSDTPEGDQFWNPIYEKYAKIEGHYR